MPPELMKIVEVRVKEGKFATVSEYVRHLIRLENTEKLARELEEDRKQFEAGKYKVLKSLRDLR